MSDPRDWSGEAGNPKEKKAKVPSDSLRLPIGIRVDGQVYRNVVIEEMTGIDDHLIAGKKSGGNGAKAVSLIICRCLQEVEGLLTRKLNSEKMFDRGLARNMTQLDRDFLITNIFMLSGREEAVMAGECPRCERVWEEFVRLSDLEVIEWPDDKPMEIPFQLEVGVKKVDPKTKKETFHKDGVLKFPLGKETELVGKMDNPAEMVDSLLSACITQLGTTGGVDTETIKRLVSRDRTLLMTTIQKDLPGLRQWKEVKCRCGREFDVRMDINAFFVGRRRKTKK